MMQTFSTSCGSEVSGRHVPAVRNVGGAVRKRVSVTLPDSNRSSSWDLRRVRAIRRTIFDYAAALPLAVSSVSTTGLTAGKDRHFYDLHTPLALRGDRKAGRPLHEPTQKGEHNESKTKEIERLPCNV